MPDYAGGQGQVEFKESIGLQLVVKFDQWLAGLEQSEKAMNAFGAEATKAAHGLTTTFVVAQTKLEKTAKGITGIFKNIRNDLAKTTAMWGTASLAMAQHATTIQRSMYALEKTALSTGRSFSAQLKLIEDSIGGVASRADLLASSVSLMATSLDASQMKQFVEVVKDTSAALGTDFSANIEHAVASLKTMDTRLLANMGIMVSMEELNKKMVLKFPGADPATLSVQQQQAALLDVIIDKTKMFTGANKEMSEKGLFAWTEFKENLKDISIAIGQMFIPAWNAVAKVLASATKSLKNFFENDTVQKFGKVISAVVVPAMVLLLAAFTALTPIIGIVMKLLTVAPFVALTMAVVQFTKVLVGTGSVTQAFSAFGGALKNVGDPIGLAWKSFKSLKEIIPQLTYEMKAMQRTGESTGKYFTDLGIAVKNLGPKIKEIYTKYGVSQEAKNMTMLPFAKEQFDKLKVAAGDAIGPIKGLQQQMAAFGVAIKSLFVNIQSGMIGGIANTKKMVTALYGFFGRTMIGAMGGFRVAFAALMITIRVGIVAVGVALKSLLAYVAPLLILGFAIEGVIRVIDKLKDKWVEHKDGSKELRDEVAALKKEYQGLAVAMDKADPKKMKTQGYKDIVDYAEGRGLKGTDLTDKFLKDTGVKEAQTSGGRDNIRRIVDQKNAIKDLREGVSGAAMEFEKFAKNVTELSSRAKDSYSQMKLYAMGLKDEEDAYEGMLAKASTLNVVDIDNYIKTKIEPQRKVAVEAAVNKAKKDFASDAELKIVEENANKMFDAYIKLYKDPRKIQALLAANRATQAQLRQSMRSDDFNNKLIAGLNESQAKIADFTARAADKRNENVKTTLEEQLKIEQAIFTERYEFLKQRLDAEYNAYKGNRDRLVAMFEADLLNKTFFKAANGIRTFNTEISKINVGTFKDLLGGALKETGSTIEEIDAKLRNVSLDKLKFEFATLEVQTNKVLHVASQMKTIWEAKPGTFVDDIKVSIEEQKNLLDTWIGKWTSASNQLVDNQKNILNKQRENVNMSVEFARKMEDAARAMEVANKNILALKHTIAQQTDPTKDVQKAILEIQAQQAQAIGDVVRFTERRIKLLEEEYNAQEKVAAATKAEAEDMNLSVEKRMEAAQRELEIRKNMAQVGFELERMDPRKNVKPQAQLDRMQDLGKVLKDYLAEKNSQDMALINLSKQIEVIKRETIIEEGKLNRLKFNMEMTILAEERAVMKIQQAIAKQNVEAMRATVIGLAKLQKTTEGDALAEELKKNFAAEDQQMEKTQEKVDADKKATLDALGINNQALVDQVKAVGEQTVYVQKLVELQGKANSVLEDIRAGLVKGNEAKAQPEQYNPAQAREEANKQIVNERRISGAMSGALSGGVTTGRPTVGTDINVYPTAKSFEERMKVVGEGIKGAMGSSDVRGMEEVYKNQREALKSQMKFFESTVGRGVQFTPPQPVGGYQQFDATNKQAVAASAFDAGAWRQQNDARMAQVEGSKSSVIWNLYDRSDKLMASKRIDPSLGDDTELNADIIRNRDGDVGQVNYKV